MATSAYTLTGSEFPPLPRTLPSGAFSISARRFIISSVIGGLSVRLGSALQPYRTSSMTAAKPLARQRAVGALASGSATVELHHHPGHDRLGVLAAATVVVGQQDDMAAGERHMVRLGPALGALSRGGGDQAQ